MEEIIRHKVYQVDGWNNFCRVFEIPDRFLSGFCFGRGLPTTFQMVDWFNPVENLETPTISKKEWGEKVGEIEVRQINLFDLEDRLFPFLSKKDYIVKGKKYLILYSFGACSFFDPVNI